MINTIKEKIDCYRNSSIIEYQYIIGLLLVTFKTLCNNSTLINLSSISRYIYLIAFIMMIPKVILQKYTKKQLIFSLLLVLFNIACVLVSDTKNLILISLMLIGIKDTDIKKIVKYIFVLTMIVIIIHFSVYIYRCILDGYSIFQIFTLDREIHRGTILYKSNNNFAMLTACSILQYIYITDRKSNKALKVIVLCIYSFITYLLGQSKASLIISVLLILYFVFEDSKFLSRDTKVIKICSITASILFSLFMLVVDVNTKFGSFINKCLTGRAGYEQMYYEKVGLSSFPQIEKYDKLVTTHIDNMYISILLKWGLLFSIIFIAFIVYLAFINNSKIDSCFLSIILIWGIVENAPKLLSITIVALLLFSNFYLTSKRKET